MYKNNPSSNQHANVSNPSAVHDFVGGGRRRSRSSIWLQKQFKIIFRNCTKHLQQPLTLKWPEISYIHGFHRDVGTCVCDGGQIDDVAMQNLLVSAVFEQFCTPIIHYTLDETARFLVWFLLTWLTERTPPPCPSAGTLWCSGPAGRSPPAAEERTRHRTCEHVSSTRTHIGLWTLQGS